MQQHHARGPAASWKFMLTFYSRPLVLHVLATAGPVRPEGNRYAVAVRDIHLAVGLEGDIMGGRVARDNARGSIDEVAEGVAKCSVVGAITTNTISAGAK